MIVSVDLTYRGVDYRIADPYRAYGATVQPASHDLACERCARPIKPGARLFMTKHGIVTLCIRCAVRDGWLVPLTSAAERGAGEAR